MNMQVKNHRWCNVSNRFFPILWGIVCCLVLALPSCRSVVTNPKLPTAPAVETVTSNTITYPILLLHGLGQKSHAWEGTAVNFYQRDMGLNFGGILSMKSGKATCSGSGTGDFYTVSFTNPYDSVAVWGRELAQYVNYVLTKTRAEKVILIAYSMGGLASRYYLTNNFTSHRVKRLITIGTPHLGSPFANVYTIKTTLTKKISEANAITAPIYKAGLSVLTAAEGDMPFDSPAIGDLRLPNDGGVFLDRLGKAEHPGDVEYVSVVGDVDVAGEVQKLNTTAVQEVLRRALEFLGSGQVSALLNTGDGVVSSQSQTLNNIPFFKNNPAKQRLVRTVTLGSLHTDHLRSSNEIQRVTLEDKPEFKSAEFYTVNGNPSLVIDFSDYLPAKMSSVTVTYPSFAGDRTVKAQSLTLVRKENGEVVCRAIIPFGGDVNFAEGFDAHIVITNYFGNTATTTKQWRILE
jgi:pimeloyl-ACP methyl ester carboxylesterase